MRSAYPRSNWIALIWGRGVVQKSIAEREFYLREFFLCVHGAEVVVWLLLPLGLIFRWFFVFCVLIRPWATFTHQKRKSPPTPYTFLSYIGAKIFHSNVHSRPILLNNGQIYFFHLIQTSSQPFKTSIINNDFSQNKIFVNVLFLSPWFYFCLPLSCYICSYMQWKNSVLFPFAMNPLVHIQMYNNKKTIMCDVSLICFGAKNVTQTHGFQLFFGAKICHKKIWRGHHPTSSLSTNKQCHKYTHPQRPWSLYINAMIVARRLMDPDILGPIWIIAKVRRHHINQRAKSNVPKRKQ